MLQPKHHATGSLPLTRRSFLLATLAAGALPFRVSSEEPARMRHVTLGRTGIKSSVFLGDWMGSEEMYRIALEAGVNYWHKIGEWRNPAPYEIFRKLDRDSFACDTTISTLKKDEAIETFERKRKKAGLEMIDGFKIHSMYRSAEEVRTKMGAVQAFEALKRQGRTRFLMLSQHINTAEVFEAAVESDLFDLIQVPVNPTVPQNYFSTETFPNRHTRESYFQIVSKAAAKGIAIVAMKVFLGGTRTWDYIEGLRNEVRNYLPDDGSIATALIHWALDIPGVKAFGNILFNRDQLEQNLKAASGRLTKAEDRGLRILAGRLGSEMCRMCGACTRAFPEGPAVSEILRFRSYYISGETERARAEYRELHPSARYQEGVNLLPFEQACPYGLPLARLVREAHALLA
jgi:predicted aldo/keto reductase-like oxidoreductase